MYVTDYPEVRRTVGDLSICELSEQLRSGVGLQLGPFAAKIVAQPGRLVEPLYSLYSEYPLLDANNVFSFHVRIDERRGFPDVRKRLVRFSVDGRVPHEDMPAEQALPVLEWGINLVIALRSHAYLMLHSAVVERHGLAMILPAAPGHGKTTLSAGLALRGWRLLSDEFGLIRPKSTQLVPVPRPMALKNESISVIRDFAPEAVLGPETPNTRKGTVAHVKPPGDSVSCSGEPAEAKWIVFPRWRPGAACQLEEISPAEGLMLLATNAFNYELLGDAAFETVTRLVDKTRSFRFEYSDLEAAVAVLTEFSDQNRA